MTLRTESERASMSSVRSPGKLDIVHHFGYTVFILRSKMAKNQDGYNLACSLFELNELYHQEGEHGKDHAEKSAYYRRGNSWSVCSHRLAASWHRCRRI